MLRKNIDLGKPLRLSSWRKVALGTWGSAHDPTVYGMIEADVTAALAFVEELRSKTGERITLTHVVGRCLAQVFAEHPEINGVIRFGRIYPRKTVDIFFQVASDNTGEDLSGFTIRDANKKSVAEIAAEMGAGVKLVREKSDPAFRRMKRLFGLFPGIFARPLISLSGFLMYTCNLWTSLMGVPRDPFGSAMVTNIGSLGLEMAYVPLVPYSRTPLVMAVGAVTKKPVVQGDQVAVVPMAKLCVSFDHRMIDGVHASRMIQTFNRLFANPGAITD